MVSEADYDANQKKFTEQQQMSQTFPGMTQQQVQDIKQRTMRVTPALGVASGPVQAGANMLKERLIAGALGATVFAFIAGGRDIAAGAIGREWNKFASDNNLDTGKLRLAAFEQMYTTPIEDPKTGQWTYLFSDETQLRERMREAGVDADLIPSRIMQLDQQRQANAEAIAAAGSPQDLASQQIPGETALETAQRVAKQNFMQQQANNQIGNAQGLTVAQINQANNDFNRAVKTAEIQRQQRESGQKVMTNDQLAQMPPGQLEPSDMEKLLKSQLPNESVAPAAPPPTQPKQPAQTVPSSFSPLYKTKDAAQNALGMSMTDEAWQRYLKTGRLPGR